MEKKINYKDTLNLPKTNFPMKADLGRLEPRILDKWEKEEIYRKIQDKTKDLPRYILHDGPPYANGHIHQGHALNKILKDLIIKSKVMDGHSSPYVPGWDCHGLPIEHQVLKDLGSKKEGMSKLEIRRRCREYADRFVDIQRNEFKRLGVFGDWNNPYLTMTPDYEAAIVREFGKIVATGSVYKGKKPVLWCSFDETALAEAEVEYADHTSPSVYVKFPVVNTQGLFPVDTAVVIWTTTPWTLVANRAISVHPDFNYHLVKTKVGNLIIAGYLIDSCLKAFGLRLSDVTIEPQFSGSKIADPPILCRHPWLDLTVPIILGEHVTKDQGTGCVHTAPGHGQEDYEVGLKYGLEVYTPVDHHGKFTQDAGRFAGQKVFEANKEIIGLLKDRGMLLKEETITHSYPHCWRCKNPVIFRATEQWFISMDKNRLRERAINAIKNDIKWIPKWGKDRILGMMEGRPDWCISRQRAWGVPIVAFTCLDCKEVLLSQDIVNYVADQMEKTGEGSDIWFSKTADKLMPEGTSCPACKGNRFQQEADILDVWFESGVSHAAVLKRRQELKWPADLYLEGSDQHRGWFHSSLLTALLSDGQAPYNAVLTHGFVVDGNGKKMSKSAGNVVAPQEVINKYGAEILRLWVAASDYRDDVRVSDEILCHLAEAYRKIRNTCRFLLGNIYDFDPDTDLIPHNKLTEIDRWALHSLQILIEKSKRGYLEFEFHLVFHSLNNFCSVEMSSFYLDILKDRLYTAGKGSLERRSSQTALYLILLSITKLMAPLLSFTAEELWECLPKKDKEESVYVSGFPEVDEQYKDPDLGLKWERLRDVRNHVLALLEKARQERLIGSSLEASVSIYANEEWFGLLKAYENILPFTFIVSEVSVSSLEGVLPETRFSSLCGVGRIDVSKASGDKCERCWNYRSSVGKDDVHPALCVKCLSAIT